MFVRFITSVRMKTTADVFSDSSVSPLCVFHICGNSKRDFPPDRTLGGKVCVCVCLCVCVSVFPFTSPLFGGLGEGNCVWLSPFIPPSSSGLMFERKCVMRSVMMPLSSVIHPSSVLNLLRCHIHAHPSPSIPTRTVPRPHPMIGCEMYDVMADTLHISLMLHTTMQCKTPHAMPLCYVFLSSSDPLGSAHWDQDSRWESPFCHQDQNCKKRNQDQDLDGMVSIPHQHQD